MHIYAAVFVLALAVIQHPDDNTKLIKEVVQIVDSITRSNTDITLNCAEGVVK